MEYPVFILDNDKSFLKLLTEVLSEHFIIIGTTDTNDFIKKVKHPAVIIIDWYLDFGVSGIDVMKRVRKENPLTHVIYISNAASKDVLLSVINEGWGCYFIEKDKSNFFTELVEKIKTAKSLLREKIAVAGIELKRNELLRDRLSTTLNFLESSSNGRST